MSMTGKQKERERMAQLCERFAGRKNQLSAHLRATNRAVEKRKRAQFGK
jgi:hypothetical protein